MAERNFKNDAKTHNRVHHYDTKTLFPEFVFFIIWGKILSIDGNKKLPSGSFLKQIQKINL